VNKYFKELEEKDPSTKDSVLNYTKRLENLGKCFKDNDLNSIFPTGNSNRLPVLPVLFSSHLLDSSKKQNASIFAVSEKTGYS